MLHTALPSTNFPPTLPDNACAPVNTSLPPLPAHLWDVEQSLQLLHERPFLIADVGAIVLLQGVDALPRDQTVQHVLFLEVPAVHGLVGSFDLDGDGRLAFFADGDLFVVALDGLAGGGR